MRGFNWAGVAVEALWATLWLHHLLGELAARRVIGCSQGKNAINYARRVRSFAFHVQLVSKALPMKVKLAVWT